LSAILNRLFAEWICPCLQKNAPAASDTTMRGAPVMMTEESGCNGSARSSISAGTKVWTGSRPPTIASAPRGRHDKPSVFERLHRTCSPPRQQTPSPQCQRAPSSPHRRPLLCQDQRPPSPPPKRVPPPKRHRQQAHDQHADDSQRRDECHLPRWCPGGLSRPQKRRVQRLRSLKQAEEDYLRLLERFNEISEIPSLRSRRSLVWKRKP
jgi:hypothetical protein